MSNSICYNTFNLFINLRVERPYLYIIQPRCLNPTQLKELLIALEKYWAGGKRKLITVILNN